MGCMTTQSLWRQGRFNVLLASALRPKVAANRIKAPDLQGQCNRAAGLMTTGRCGTDADANKLGVIRLPRGVHGRPPRHPYIWATWLPRLLTGENSCEWAV